MALVSIMRVLRSSSSPGRPTAPIAPSTSRTASRPVKRPVVMPLISRLSMPPEPVTPPQDNAIDTGRRPCQLRRPGALLRGQNGNGDSSQRDCVVPVLSSASDRQPNAELVRQDSQFTTCFDSRGRNGGSRGRVDGGCGRRSAVRRRQARFAGDRRSPSRRRGGSDVDHGSRTEPSFSGGEVGDITAPVGVGGREIGLEVASTGAVSLPAGRAAASSGGPPDGVRSPRASGRCKRVEARSAARTLLNSGDPFGRLGVRVARKPREVRRANRRSGRLEELNARLTL